MADEASTVENSHEPTSSEHWARLTDSARWPRGWWWINPPVPAINADEEVNNIRRHDEASKTIRRVMMTLIAYGFFCLFTLSQPDSVLVSGKFKLPFANIEIAFTDFLIVGPLILIGFTIYLHIFITYWHSIPLIDTSEALPFIFNMDNAMPRFLAGFLFYWLAPMVLWVFTYKAAPHGVLEPLLLLTAVTASVLLFLQIRRTLPDKRRSRIYRSVWSVFAPIFAFSIYLSGQQAVDLSLALYRSAFELVQPVLSAGLSPIMAAPGSDSAITIKPPVTASGGFLISPPATAIDPETLRRKGSKPIDRKTEQSTPRTVQRALGLTRGLNLSGVDLRKADLKAKDLRGANLSKANLSSVPLISLDLSKANLRDANLRDTSLRKSNLTKANLSYADLTGANLTSTILIGANLTKSVLTSANLSNANLSGANLSGADLISANLLYVNLAGAILFAADLTGTKNLVQSQIEECLPTAPPSGLPSGLIWPFEMKDDMWVRRAPQF